ncbi:EAL domain-containing protein [Paraglaciecola agarilytica]|uniref:EAL domain-containing protein n=1 Tax=Paraglaciecola chathamensis TaxID=368405 RepID=UPI001C087984|nr:EAL domain-containing protein [Paraglaciecola agarilytica]MBU3018773.1 EAL domain-containing protein [Paraglaciecola agarilytica]
MYLIQLCRILSVILLSGAFVFACYGQDREKNILVIHSYDEQHEWTKALTEGLETGMLNASDVRVLHEHLDAKRFPSLFFKDVFLDYLVKKYQSTPFSAIVTADDDALQFLLATHDLHFNHVPVVFMGVNTQLAEITHTSWLTGVYEYRDIQGLLRVIRQQSKSEELIVVTDSTRSGTANLSKVKRHSEFTTLHVLTDVHTEKVKAVFEAFASNTPVLVIGQLFDPHLQAYTNWVESAEILTSNSANPYYSIASITIEHGILGGRYLDGYVHAQQAAEMVVSILSGTPVSDIPEIVKAENLWIFDAQLLARYQFSRSALPKGSIIRNTQPSFYSQYKWIVWGVVSGFLAALVIILLLVAIIRRNALAKRETELNTSRYRDLADAGASIFWECDTELNYIYLSGDVVSLFGCEPEKLIGRPHMEILKSLDITDFPTARYKQKISRKEALSNVILKAKKPTDEQLVLLINAKPIIDTKNTFQGYRGILKDITKEHDLSQMVNYQANYDALTGLVNRRYFVSLLKQHFAEAKSNTEASYLCCIDVDNFKLVNESLGHQIGDAVLTEVAEVLSHLVHSRDTLGRLSGDEFALLVVDRSLEESTNLCKNLIRKVSEHEFFWEGRQLNIGISIGMVALEQGLSDIELLSKAGLSRDKAKELGRGRLFYADAGCTDLLRDQAQIGYIANISHDLKLGRFSLVKQPIVGLKDANQHKLHYEILIRYHDQDGRFISPGVFIPVAEKHGVIGLIDSWVVETTLANYATYFPEGNVTVSINLSGVSVSNEDFSRQVINLIKASRIAPQNICFEITETAVISRIGQALDFIHELKAIGVKFALDDFGSGTSSFGYLKQLPVDYLKIDGSLVRDIHNQPTDRAIVESVHSIARMMNMQTIAEFVENDEICGVLQNIGIDYGQGYGLGKPQPC